MVFKQDETSVDPVLELGNIFVKKKGQKFTPTVVVYFISLFRDLSYKINP